MDDLLKALHLIVLDGIVKVALTGKTDMLDMQTLFKARLQESN